MNAEEFGALVERIRGASRAGELTPVDEETCPGGEAEFAVLLDAAGAADICRLRESGKSFLFSERHMTRAFAEAAALGASGNPVRMIAATVRSDSATYPRPTPVETFYGHPFCLSPKEVKAAIIRMGADDHFTDIHVARASNGAEFLFSSDHMSRDQAAALSERLAVGQYDNP
jgi:hypothetical protein